MLKVWYAKATLHLSDQVCKGGATLARARRTGIALCSIAPVAPAVHAAPSVRISIVIASDVSYLTYRIRRIVY